MCSVSELCVRLEDINGSGSVPAREDNRLLMAKSADPCVLRQSMHHRGTRGAGIEYSPGWLSLGLRYRPRARAMKSAIAVPSIDRGPIQ